MDLPPSLTVPPDEPGDELTRAVIFASFLGAMTATGATANMNQEAMLRAENAMVYLKLTRARERAKLTE